MPLIDINIYIEKPQISSYHEIIYIDHDTHLVVYYLGNSGKRETERKFQQKRYQKRIKGLRRGMIMVVYVLLSRVYYGVFEVYWSDDLVYEL
jgi:hypothetical protein